MKALLWLLALFVLSVVLSLAARFNESYLLLILPPYRAEISLNLAIFLAVVLFGLLYGLLRTLALAASLPKQAREYRQRRAREEAVQIFHDAIRLFLAGRVGHALRKAAQADSAGAAPGLTALLAARCAQTLGEPVKGQAWLEKASLDAPPLQPAKLILEAELQLDEQRCADATTTLGRLRVLAGRRLAALRLELRAHEGCGNWSAVLQSTRLLERHHGLPLELARAIKQRAHRAHIAQRQGDNEQVLAYWRQLPTGEAMGILPDVADALRWHDATGELRHTIAEQLDRHWDTDLLQIYGQLHGGRLPDSLARATAWLSGHPQDRPLLLALGRLCLAQDLWGQAQTYLEEALSLADRPDVRLELARLFDRRGRADDALAHYRAAAG